MEEHKKIATKVVLEESDLDLIRVLEDLLEVLARKGVVYLEDLPPDAQDKVLQRRQLREGS